MLAPRAKVGAPTPEDDPPDGRAADKARLSFPAIDAMLDLKEAGDPVGVDVVGNRRTPGADGRLQDSPQRFVEASQLLPREAAGYPVGRMPARKRLSSRRCCRPRAAATGSQRGLIESFRPLNNAAKSAAAM